jgi:hypothetical protein
MPPTRMTSTKRFAVRLSLVTGSTLATIIGAQSLAALDRQPTVTPTSAVENAADLLLADNAQHLPLLTSTAVNDPSVVTVYAAPSITILRHPSQSSTSGASSQTASSATTIQPPAAEQIASAPVTSQQSAPSQWSAPQARTRSSR